MGKITFEHPTTNTVNTAGHPRLWRRRTLHVYYPTNDNTDWGVLFPARSNTSRNYYTL